MVRKTAEIDPVLRVRVVEYMTQVLARMLEYTDPITEAHLLMDDLGLTSSMGLELLLELEEELEIQIDVEDLDPDEGLSVGQLADYVASHSAPW